MPKIVCFGEFLKTWSLRSNSVTRQVNFSRTKIGGKCQYSNETFWVIFKQRDVALFKEKNLLFPRKFGIAHQLFFMSSGLRFGHASTRHWCRTRSGTYKLFSGLLGRVNPQKWNMISTFIKVIIMIPCCHLTFFLDRCRLGICLQFGTC